MDNSFKLPSSFHPIAISTVFSKNLLFGEKPLINISFQGAECNFQSFINVAKNVIISTTNCSIFLSLYVTEFAIGHSLRTVRATREKLLLAPFVDDSLSSQGFFFSAPNVCARRLFLRELGR
jgi:hypothetical protein